ncbi:hypothetical protein AB0B79_38655 [Streptomyces sp. NPDC039022]|uniref:hypothetical protein n=1 Tax=unclassified Streptomyces TaxID=2593676 RepID=UPI003408437E
MNPSGNAAHVRIADGTAKPTTVLEHMSAAELLAELDLSCVWVRLARPEANALLWEHRDHRTRPRRAVPAAHPAAPRLFGLPGHRRLQGPHAGRADLAADAGLRPRVCNLLGPARIRLIADVYADDACQHLAERAALAPATASQPVLAERVAAARRLGGVFK